VETGFPQENATKYDKLDRCPIPGEPENGLAGEKIQGANVVIFARRVVAFVKMLVVAAGVTTALSIAVIASLQLAFWLLANTWTPVPLARIVELSGIDVPRRYFPASDITGSSRAATPDLAEWLMNLPAIVALFMGLALLSLGYAALTSAEKRLATVSGVDDDPPAVRGPR
jgi:hypothetical protein